jgi:hypothetical protein
MRSHHSIGSTHVRTSIEKPKLGFMIIPIAATLRRIPIDCIIGEFHAFCKLLTGYCPAIRVMAQSELCGKWRQNSVGWAG